jgi:C4-dicarboxylate transporter, DctM subunit
MGAITRELMPMFAVAVAVLALVTYIEAVPMALAHLARGVVTARGAPSAGRRT